MKPTTYLLLLTLLFSACKKDGGEPEPLPVEEEHPYNTCLPTMVSYYFTNDTSSENLFYYKDGSLRKKSGINGNKDHYEIKYFYNDEKQLIRIENHTENWQFINTQNYVYDGEGNLLYEYYQAGNEKSREFLYSYDHLNRITKKTEKRNGSQVSWIYHYDKTGPALSMRFANPGVPETIEETFFRYDSKENVIEEKVYQYRNGDTLFYRWNEYEYDSDNNRTKLSYISPTSSTMYTEITTTFDEHGNQVTNTVYDNVGNVTSYREDKRTYDNRGNLILTESYIDNIFQYKIENVITCWD